MVRLSLPRPARPRVFQHSWVRPSSGCYPTFILAGRRSRGFASAAPDLTPRLRLGFPSAPRQSRLASPVTASRRIIMQKARDHPFPEGHRAPTACRHVVSGSVSSPRRGSSHLSLALLGSLSVAREYLALRDGPRRFRPASTCQVLLRCRIENLPLSRTGLSPALVRLSRRFR